MFKIVSKEQFSEKVFRLRVEAPLIAKAYRAGNFVILRVGEKGERIPLTIADYDLKNEYLSFLSDNSVYCLGANPRITGPDYLFLNDFKFCIVNGKRGVRAYSIGKIRYDENKVYYALMNEDRDSHYFFFYWDKNEQRYILDETVTENQLQNAWCPEDYFAYNGLKFSKLDSKLIDADLKDLDKAQLRLMRNAVYARHGRTFKSVDLQSLWECYTWYKKNPNYSDSLLTDIDKYNIELIQKYESQ